MTLIKWIEAVGDAHAAKVLGCTERTARAWRVRYRTPHPKTAKKIAEKLKGKVTFAEIYS